MLWKGNLDLDHFHKLESQIEAFTCFIYSDMIDTIVECKNVQISEVWIKLNTGARVMPTIESNGIMIYFLAQYTETIYQGFLIH